MADKFTNTMAYCSKYAAILLALSAASLAASTGDLCVDDDSPTIYSYAGGEPCYMMGDCDDETSARACPFTCSFREQNFSKHCDAIYPLPDCQPDEIAMRKEQLCAFLVDANLTDDCGHSATDIASEHIDPCDKTYKDVLVLCDRCGDVRQIFYVGREVPEVSGGIWSDTFFTFKKLQVFVWMDFSKSFPTFQLPRNHSLLEFPALTYWVVSNFNMSIEQASSTSLLSLIVWDSTNFNFPEARLDHVQFSGKLNQLSLQEKGGGNSIVGTIPDSICENPHLKYIELQKTMRVSGTIPTCLANLTELQYVIVDSTQLSGPVAPLLMSLNSQYLSIWHNPRLGGPLPSTLSSMGRLRVFEVVNASVSGDIPDIDSPALIRMNVRNNFLTGAGKLSASEGAKKAYVSVAYNLIEQFPASWSNLTGVQTLNLSGNPLKGWPLAGVIPPAYRKVAFGGGATCPSGVPDIEPRFHWPGMETLDVNHCPLNSSILDFLYSLTYTSIVEITADNCSLHGGLDHEAYPSMLTPIRMPPYSECVSEHGFTSLSALSLRHNHVTYIDGLPWWSLKTIDLRNNDLEFILVSSDPEYANHPGWFDGGVHNIKLNGNPDFRTAISPPPDERCPVGFTGALVADPTLFSIATSHRGDMECTVLCPLGPSVDVDSTANESLCRPVCQSGWYRETATSPACIRCQQWPFQTSAGAGSVSAEMCSCSAEYSGLRAIELKCGCDDDYFMNRATKTCEKCNYAEMCAWKADIGRSLSPPRIRAGYWNDPASQSDPFSGNDIWRCRSKTTCGIDGKCASGRGGVACSLCLPGKFGGPDGECFECPGTPAYHWMLGILIIIGMSPFFLVIHGVIVGKSESRSFLMTLRAFRRSARQMIRQVQAVAIVSGYSVSWPPLAKMFFHQLTQLSFAFPSWAGAACFGSEQSATTEMTFRWLSPLAVAVSISLAVPLSRLVFCKHCCLPRLLMKAHSNPDSLKMTTWDVIRVFVFCCVMFYATLLQYSFMIFTCMESPNGKSTVVDFPHLECSSRGTEYITLAAFSALFALLTLGGLFGSIVYAFITHVREWTHSGFNDNGWWGFLFEDFRSTRSYWVFILMSRDMCLVVIGMVCQGNGLAQLFLVALLSLLVCVRVVTDSPYVDRSNTILEGWNHGAMAMICVYTAGMGYESTPGLAEVSERYDGGEDNAAFRTRAAGMFAVQLLAFLVPCIILSYQLMIINAYIRRRLPSIIRPHSVAENEAWSRRFLDYFYDRSTNEQLLKGLDNVEFHTFRSTIAGSMATIGTDGLDDSGSLSPKTYVKRKASSWKSSTASETRIARSRQGNRPPPQHSESQDVKPELVGCPEEAGSSHQREPSDNPTLITIQDGGEAAKPDSHLSL